MAASPVEHAEQARLALRTIVAEHGPATLSNPRTLSNLLSDLLPDSPRLARLLVAAAQDRIADDLREHTSDGMDAETASRLVASAFADATLFAPDACRWVVAEIALALGLIPDPGPAQEQQSERINATATARFVAAPQIGAVTATEPASLSELLGEARIPEPRIPEPRREARIPEPRIPEPRREDSPRPVWPRTAPDQAPADPEPGPEPDPEFRPEPGPEQWSPDQPGADGDPTVPPAPTPTPAPAPAPTPTPAPAPAPTSTPAPAPAPTLPLTWTAMVTADRGYFDSVISDGHVEASSITFPEDCPPRRFELSGAQLRIGRRSVSRGLTPEIDLSGPPLDPGISHLHAILVARDDGTWSVQDAGSSNGTQVNGDEIAVGVPVVLGEGDRICLGAWTVVTVHAH